VWPHQQANTFSHKSQWQALMSLQITVTRLYPEGMEPPPKRRQFIQRQASPDSQQDADINTKTIGAAEPVDSIQPESRQGMYAGLGLESSDED